MKSIELEAKFIEQEHRLIRIWINFWLSRQKWEKDDPRRTAASTAFIWSLIRPVSYVFVSGGAVALISLYFLSKQTSLLEEQNLLVANQNQLLLNQINLQQEVNIAARKTELIKSIYASSGNSIEAGFHTKTLPEVTSRVRSEALAEYLALRKTEANANLEEFKQTGKRPAVATLPFGVDLRDAPLQEVSLNQLDMGHMSLYNSSFERAKLYFVDFSNSQLEYTNFNNSNLHGSIFYNTSLVGSYMVGADLSGIKWNEETVVKNANIYGVKHAPKGFKEWAIKQGALEISNKDEWIKKNIQTFPALKERIDEHLESVSN
ncbi:pentapeptide repeat-containing protein [Vibrio aestuarianus]|uniref:Pentapeptide repeat-containing protein n=1 Tax=Vibrio aestuarianus TaxID=28171 RepID=A0ABD7YPY4_9VIBR|nr:pentapeptide repeat-containing protein [Vibrio aestuarianus]WGK87158.1 pentapeptide repeat-containing protein [Vibrio aestuarianus]CAH8236469.1 hypothetical protein VAEU17_4400142 [Vibrio aestuarianus]